MLLFFTYLMLRIILQYIPYNTDVAFLRIKQQYIHIGPWRWAFFIHVYCSLFVLFAGFTQFSQKLRAANPSFHRMMGYLYVLNILLVTGPASLVMGVFANGGISSRIAFVLLSLLWMYFTLRAIIAARNQQFDAHQKFMIRSYALTLSAITLRIWKFGISNTLTIPPLDTYRIVAWLSWTLNLIFAEYYIRKYLHKRSLISGLK